MVLLLKRTLYGTKQVALQFWRELVKVLTGLLFKQSSADPCLFFKHVNGSLNIWISWVDDLLNVGEAKVNEKEKEEFKKKFDCNDVGELIEFVGVKIVIDQANRTAKLTQLVLLQSFGDEFEIGSSHVDIPATAGHVISNKREDVVYLSPEKQRVFRSGVGKLMHLSKWS
jgi:Reverse transcriptase (RNA-dependent DNA polymerase)